MIKSEILKFIAPSIRHVLEKANDSMWNKAEEIRIGINKPLIIFDCDMSYFLTGEGALTTDIDKAYICLSSCLSQTIQLITQNSIYAVNDKLKNGYITLPRGHRVGIVGTVVMNGPEISYIKDISCINFRLKREIKGLADNVIRYIITNNQIKNTLIIAPPQCGKTTLLRDITRVISNGENKLSGFKVGLIDERSEIAAMYNGEAQNDVGIRTAVLDFCPKDKGMIMMIRSMSPNVIVTDELGLKNDIEALKQVLNCGVKIITTVHGNSLEDIKNKPAFKEVLSDFETIIILSKKCGTGTIEKIYRRGIDDF